MVVRALFAAFLPLLGGIAMWAHLADAPLWMKAAADAAGGLAVSVKVLQSYLDQIAPAKS